MDHAASAENGWRKKVDEGDATRSSCFEMREAGRYCRVWLTICHSGGCFILISSVKGYFHFVSAWLLKRGSV